MATILDQDALLNRWLVENEYSRVEERGGKRYTLAEMSRDLGLDYGNLARIARVRDWNGELRRYNDKKSEAALEAARVITAFDEGEIRGRHALVAKSLLQKALKKLETVDPQDLSIKDAVSMLEIALREERTAVGMTPNRDVYVPEVLEYRTKETVEEDRTIREAAVQMARFVNKKFGAANNAVTPSDDGVG